MGKPLILLDRDGVLNRLVVDAEHGTIDSPLHPRQVEVLPGVPEALALLTHASFGIAIVTNQPAAAKKKTTWRNLEAVHAAVLARATSAGGRVLSSHVCFHRAEDRCDCRKPRTGLLRAAFAAHPDHDPGRSWMAGDGVTDVQAGAALGLRTAFLGPRKCDACKVFEGTGALLDFWGPDLPAFAAYLIGHAEGEDEQSNGARLTCEDIRGRGQPGVHPETGPGPVGAGLYHQPHAHAPERSA
jgi:D-glycero-D-manno-heptose 1,7-bisphosphate phosphatase